MREHQSPSHPVILSMEIYSWDDSDYRTLIEGQVKYLIIAPGTYDRETLSMPLSSLPSLPKGGNWNMTHISRDAATSELKTALQSIKLAGVRETWHPTSVNCLELSRTRQLTVAAFETRCPSLNLVASPTSAMEVIAKIARFGWEIPRIEQETRAYKNSREHWHSPSVSWPYPWARPCYGLCFGKGWRASGDDWRSFML